MAESIYPYLWMMGLVAMLSVLQAKLPPLDAKDQQPESHFRLHPPTSASSALQAEVPEVFYGAGRVSSLVSV